MFESRWWWSLHYEDYIFSIAMAFFITKTTSYTATTKKHFLHYKDCTNYTVTFLTFLYLTLKYLVDFPPSNIFIGWRTDIFVSHLLTWLIGCSPSTDISFWYTILEDFWLFRNVLKWLLYFSCVLGTCHCKTFAAKIISEKISGSTWNSY